jgi:hypothetical protein
VPDEFGDAQHALGRLAALLVDTGHLFACFFFEAEGRRSIASRDERR